MIGWWGYMGRRTSTGDASNIGSSHTPRRTTARAIKVNDTRQLPPARTAPEAVPKTSESRNFHSSSVTRTGGTCSRGSYRIAHPSEVSFSRPVPPSPASVAERWLEGIGRNQKSIRQPTASDEARSPSRAHRPPASNAHGETIDTATLNRERS